MCIHVHVRICTVIHIIQEMSGTKELSSECCVQNLKQCMCMSNHYQGCQIKISDIYTNIRARQNKGIDMNVSRGYATPGSKNTAIRIVKIWQLE